MASLDSPTWFDWIMVLAIVVGPVLALSAQRLLDRMREKKNRRTGIYLTLMALRATPLHPDHVKALNSLDTVFDGRGAKDQKIRKAWETALTHFNTKRPDADPEMSAWDNRLVDLRVDLYQAVGQAVGYDHSVEYIKSHIYTPIAFGNAELDMLKIRGGLAKIVTDDGLKVIVEEPPQV